MSHIEMSRLYSKKGLQKEILKFKLRVVYHMCCSCLLKLSLATYFAKGANLRSFAQKAFFFYSYLFIQRNTSHSVFTLKCLRGQITTTTKTSQCGIFSEETTSAI